MLSPVLVRACPEQGYRWYYTSFEPPHSCLSGSGSLDCLRRELGARRVELCLMLSGAHTSNRIVSFVAQESRHLRAAIPFQLEDTLLGDIDDLHFAFGRWHLAAGTANGNDAEVAVAWCRREWLQRQLAPFAELQLELASAVPESLLLVREGGWSLHLDDQLLCHIDHGFGFSIEPALITESLQLLLQQAGQPSRIQLSAPTQERLEHLQAALPPAIRGLAECYCQTLVQRLAPLQPDSVQSVIEWSGLNLLQGVFAPPLPLARWWQQWRNLAAMVLLAITAWSTNSILDIQQLKQQQARLQDQIELTFRTVVPEGLLVDAEKQLRNRLLALGNDSNYRGPVGLLSSIAPVLAEDRSVELKGFSYNLRQGDVRLNCQAGSFTAIEQLLSRLQQQGLNAELVHSSADGDGQRARLRIAWSQT